MRSPTSMAGAATMALQLAGALAAVALLAPTARAAQIASERPPARAHVTHVFKQGVPPKDRGATVTLPPIQTLTVQP